MGVFEQFPYTNYHDLNLDWVIKIVQENKTQVDENTANILAFETNIITVVIPEKVDDKLQSMVDDGSLEVLINERVLYDKIDKEEALSLIAALTFGVKGAYTTLIALEAAKPAGAEGVYVVVEDQKWYYWNGANWAAGAVFYSNIIADGTVKHDMLDNLMKRRFFPQVRQGVDPCYIAARTWAVPSNVGLGSSTWNANNGIFSEGYYYLENYEVDVNYNDSFYIELDEIYRGRTDLKVRFEITYISDADAVFTMYQSDIKKSSGLYNGGTLTLPNSGGVEKTLELVAPIFAADVRFLKPNVNVNANGTLKVGSLKCSILTYSSGIVSPVTSEADTALFTVSNDEYNMKDQTLLGMNDITKLQEKGVSITDKDYVRLTNITFKNFAGGCGLYVENAYGEHDTLAATGLIFRDNAIGANLEERAEYCVFTNCHFTGNGIGAKIRGGNNMMNACNINDNVDGIQLLAGENDSHGIISNCQINHNTQYAIYIDGIGSGETFIGNHVYYGGVMIKNTNGTIRFIGGVLKMDTLTIDAAFNVFFEGVYVQIEPENVHLLNGGVIKGRNNICNANIDAIFNTL